MSNTNNWVAASDRMPNMPVDEEGFPFSADVLVYCAADGFIGIAHASLIEDAPEWYLSDDFGGDHCAGVTHWMELPKPPTRANSKQGGAA